VIFRTRHAKARTGEGLTARARLDRRTKNLVPRLERGEIAVIHHQDIDRVAAEGLVAAGVSAVVNAAPSMSGRYPALGALVLLQAEIPVIDNIGDAAFNRVADGDELSIVENRLFIGGVAIGKGVRRRTEELEIQLESAREAVRGQLGEFATNTLEYLAREPELLTDDPAIPDLGVDMNQRQVLVVVRGLDYKEDLAALRRSGYMREMRPVIIGVDGGADALIDLGVTPDVILGDFDSVSRDALDCGAALLVHAYPGGDAPGASRLDRLGYEYEVIEALGTSEDVAMQIAFEERAELIVMVGSHTSMADFFDKGRSGMASTFLTRMKVSSVLVDAKGVSRLYRTQVRKRDLSLLILSALFTIVVIAVVTEPVRLLLRTLWINLGL
jgi:uncharacterized membrane-anchored protein